MKTRIQQAVKSPWFSVGIILFVLLTARAFRVWSLGVYWDDWRILARGVDKGPFEIFRYMAGERILMGVSHALLFALFGPHPLAWHLTNLLLEFAIAVLIYLLLRRLLPDDSLLPVLAACLFVAYPLSVIRMHMINVYINVATLLAGLSLYLTSLPLGRGSSPVGSFKHRMATLAAAVLIPLYLLSYEMPVGFEVVRIYILWTILARLFTASASLGERAARLIKAYVPYALGLAVFAFGRIVVYPRLAKALGADLRIEFGLDSLTMPGIGISAWTPGPFKIIHILFHTLVAPWLHAAAKLVELRPRSWTWTTAWFLGVAAFGVVLAYGFYRTNLESQKPQLTPESNNTRSWFRLLIFSIAALGATLVPVWVHPSQAIYYDNINSRNGYVASTIAGLVFLTLIGWLTNVVSRRKTRGGNVLTAMAALLIGLGTGYNSLLTDDWIEEWRRTQSTWRQILNRVPNLKEDSLLVLSRPDTPMTSVLLGLRHRDIFEPAQLFYGIGYKRIMGAPMSRANQFGVHRWIQSWLGTGEWQTKKIPASVGALLQPVGAMVNRDQILILDECEGCVKVVDKGRRIQNVSSPVINSISQFSNTDVILPPSEASAQNRLRRILLATPEPTWCEFYATAGWLQEQKDWSALVNVYRETQRYGFMPTNPIEWLPFIEALDRCERYDVADELLVWVRAGSAHCQRLAKEMLNGILEDHKHLGRPAERMNRQISFLHIDEGKLEP